MPHHLLDHNGVYTALDKPAGKRMTECMACHIWNQNICFSMILIVHITVANLTLQCSWQIWRLVGAIVPVEEYKVGISLDMDAASYAVVFLSLLLRQQALSDKFEHRDRPFSRFRLRLVHFIVAALVGQLFFWISRFFGFMREIRQTVFNCDLVFLDPDNGLNVKSVKKGTRKSVKYAWTCEIADYIADGKSVIFYNHRPRKKADAYFSEYSARLAVMKKPVHVLTFPRRSVRDYFIIPAQPSHEAKIRAALQSMEEGSFGKTGFCRLRPFPDQAVNSVY